MGYTVCQQVAMSFPQLTSERYSRTSGQALCHLPTAAALRFWYGIAVLPCFSASGNIFLRHSLWSPHYGAPMLHIGRLPA